MDLPLADQGKRKVGQGRKVARGPHRALGGHPRQDTGIDQLQGGQLVLGDAGIGQPDSSVKGAEPRATARS